jgi:hypothetical protein
MWVMRSSEKFLRSQDVLELSFQCINESGQKTLVYVGVDFQGTNN